jgi:hypothetical protein
MAGGPPLQSQLTTKARVPHLRDGIIVAKVGHSCESANRFQSEQTICPGTQIPRISLQPETHHPGAPRQR